MKYVKIYDSKMIPLGVVDIEGELPSEASNKYVKVYKPDLSQAGVVQLGAISEAQGSLLVNVYDENMKPCGTSAASVLTPSDPTVIDLGLPSGTKWRSMNLGAESPTDAGLYFQWGDTEGYTADQVGRGAGQKMFDSYLTDYKFTEDGGNTFTKYNGTDNKTVLEAADDAAVAALGLPWMMPTTEQIQELFNEEYTTNQWVTNYQGSGVNGRLVTSKSNGNSVFFPAAGSASDGSVIGAGSSCNCWSSSLNSGNVNEAWGLNFGSSYPNAHASSIRSNGRSVRPVQNASV